MSAGFASFEAAIESKLYQEISEQAPPSGDIPEPGTAVLQAVRNDAALAGVAFNGLPILASAPGLAAYQQANVITSAGFLKTPADFASIEAAIRSALDTEISGEPIPSNAAPQPGTAGLVVARKRR